MRKKILFGAGKIGKRAYDFYTEAGINIDYFCDNAANLWGTRINQIKVLSPEELMDIRDLADIYITCKDAKEIYAQLVIEDFDKNHIFFCKFYSGLGIDKYPLFCT